MSPRFITILFALLIPSAVFAANPDTFLYINVRETKLRQDPQFWAPTVANLPYGTRLAALGSGSKGSWLKVRLDSNEGYVHVSAVTKRRVVLSSAGIGAGDKVDPNTVVLAGKGFNRQVEQSYATSKGLDFKSVDEVEQYQVKSSEGAAFIKTGKLSEG